MNRRETADAAPHPPMACLLGRICGLCAARRRDLWPVKPLTPYELDRWFGESWGHPHDPRCARLREFAGAADPAQQLQPFDLMTVLSDGYSRGLAAASQVEVADQMAVLIAEMRAEQWRGEG